MFCGKCGGQVNDGVAFCPACGNAMNSAAAPAQQPAMPGMGMQQPTMQGAQQPNANYPPGYVPKKYKTAYWLALINCTYLYVGNTGLGILGLALEILAWIGVFTIGILGWILIIPAVVFTWITMSKVKAGKVADSQGYALLKE